MYLLLGGLPLSWVRFCVGVCPFKATLVLRYVHSKLIKAGMYLQMCTPLRHRYFHVSGSASVRLVVSVSPQGRVVFENCPRRSSGSKFLSQSQVAQQSDALFSVLWEL